MAGHDVPSNSGDGPQESVAREGLLMKLRREYADIPERQRNLPKAKRLQAQIEEHERWAREVRAEMGEKSKANSASARTHQMTSQEELKSFAATFQSALAQVDEAGSTSRDQETPRTEAARKTTARYRAVSPPEAEAKVVSQTPRTEYGLLTKLGHTFLGKSWEVRKTELQQYVINKGSTDWDKVAYWKKYIEDSANNTNGRGRINLRNLERDIDKSFGY